MGIKTEDIMKFQSIIKFSVEFLNSRENLKDLKLYKKKHLVGSAMPNIELISAAGAYPVFPIRMYHFGDASVAKSLSLGKSILGDGLLSNLIQFAGKLDRTKTVDTVIRSLIDGIFTRYDQMYRIGVDECGVPEDECYGIKILCGMYHSKGKNLSATFHQTIRCSAWQKTYETWTNYAPGIFLEIPPFDGELVKELATAEVKHAAVELSKITGIEITNERLRRVTEITNECKDLSIRIIEIALGDYLPIHPVSMAQLLSLIEICFHDYLSNPKKFRDLLRDIVKEMDYALEHSTSLFDARDYKKIFFTVRFGGWEHLVEDFVFEHKGRIIYADWFLYGFMNKIKTTGDMFENYADYLIKLICQFGANNKEVIKEVVDFVSDNDIDGLIYNQLFGCHSVSTAYNRLRRDLLELDIPSTMINFTNVGDNLQQTKTRCTALMEILHA